MGGRKTALIVCEFCKKEIYVYPYEIKTRKHNLCLKCLNSYKSGEKSSTWKGGHPKKEYKINDNLVCSICYRKDVINKVKLLKYQED